VTAEIQSFLSALVGRDPRLLRPILEQTRHATAKDDSHGWLEFAEISGPRCLVDPSSEFNVPLEPEKGDFPGPRGLNEIIVNFDTQSRIKSIEFIDIGFAGEMNYVEIADWLIRRQTLTTDTTN